MKALRFSVSVPRYLALKALGWVSKRPFTSGPLATVKLVDVAEPSLPSPAWVKIRTLVCGFCASDLNLILLRESPTASPFTSFPCVMGHEVCGEIVEVGALVEGLAPGDRVTVSPGLGCETRGINPVCPACAQGRLSSCENFARGALSPGMFLGVCKDTGGGFSPMFVAHQSQVFKLPVGMAAETGALMEPLSVGLQAVMENRPQAGEEVLVVGSGVMGGMVIRAIRGLDADCGITAVDPSAFAADLARQAGADRVVSPGELFGRTVEITGATRYRPMMGEDILMGGYARIYDTVGSPRTVNTSLRCLRAGGTLSLVGLWHHLKLDPTPLWLKHQTLRGVFECGLQTFRGSLRHVFDIGLTLVREGKVRLDGLITHRFALEDFQKMITMNMAKERYRAMKTVVVFD